MPETRELKKRTAEDVNIVQILLNKTPKRKSYVQVYKALLIITNHKQFLPV